MEEFSIKKFLIRKFGKGFDILDKRLRDNLSSKKVYAWYKDLKIHLKQFLKEVITWLKII